MKSEHTRAWLALALVAIIALLVTGLFFVQIPTENKDLVNIALGFVAGYVASVMGYYFGSSDQNHKKEDMQADAATGKPNDPVHIESEDKP